MKFWLVLLCFCFNLGAYDEVQPYLLPDNHPVKQALDKIFSKSSPGITVESLRKVGFIFRSPRDDRHLIAAKHPFIPGYMVKAVLDNQHHFQQEWHYWINRIQGARIIQQSLDTHGYNHLMKVPKKWIYPLPKPSRIQYVLVVEDMHLESPMKNRARYRKSMNPERLDALYVVLTENLLIDSVFVDNIPFCTDGKIAFIDTEHYLTTMKPMRLDRLLPYFSEKMHAYWNQKIH